MQRTKYNSNLKFLSGMKSCATCPPGIRKCPFRLLCLKLVDGLDEVAVGVLVNMFCSEIREMMLRLHILNGDRSFLHELLHEEEPEDDVLHPWAKGPVYRHVHRRCVIDENENALESLLEA